MNKKETIKTIQENVIAVYPHFDKIIFIADSDVSYLDIDKLSNPNLNNKRLPAKISKVDTPFMQSYYKIELYQPTRDNIEYLLSATANESVFLYANKVEVTYDIISAKPTVVSNLIARHFVVTKNHKLYYKNVSATHYWGYREKNVSKMFPILYSDRLSKITGQSCVHFEFRLEGKPICNAYKLSTPSDFLQFDFVCFFIKNTKFYLALSKTELGGLIDMERDQTCNTPRGKQKLFDKVADEEFGLNIDDPIQIMLKKLPSLKNYYSSRPMKANNKKFTADFQTALLSNLKPY